MDITADIYNDESLTHSYQFGDNQTTQRPHSCIPVQFTSIDNLQKWVDGKDIGKKIEHRIVKRKPISTIAPHPSFRFYPSKHAFSKHARTFVEYNAIQKPELHSKTISRRRLSKKNFSESNLVASKHATLEHAKHVSSLPFLNVYHSTKNVDSKEPPSSSSSKRTRRIMDGFQTVEISSEIAFQPINLAQQHHKRSQQNQNYIANRKKKLAASKKLVKVSKLYKIYQI